MTEDEWKHIRALDAAEARAMAPMADSASHAGQGLPEPAWCVPQATGAYWFQIEGSTPDICWIHKDMVMFSTPPYGTPDSAKQLTEDCGLCFWGPIPWPTPRADTKREPKSEDKSSPAVDALESRDFYEACQTYRHSTLGGLEFEALKAWIRKNATVNAQVTDPQYSE